MIEGVQVKKLRLIPDERGYLMEIFRRDDPQFRRFGQVYLTTAYPGVVKAWHYHKKQWDNFAVIRGMAKVVLFDSREESPTRGEVMEFFMGDQNPVLLTIPPKVMHGFKGCSTEMAMIVNTPSELYNYQEPDEYRVAPHDGVIPYDWERKDG